MENDLYQRPSKQEYKNIRQIIESGFSDPLRIIVVENIEKVVNPRLEAKFNTRRRQLPQQETLLKFHGTPSSNIESIATNGFLLPAANATHGADKTELWYGPGIYFTSSSAKADRFSQVRLSPFFNYFC